MGDGLAGRYDDVPGRRARGRRRRWCARPGSRSTARRESAAQVSTWPPTPSGATTDAGGAGLDRVHRRQVGRHPQRRGCRSPARRRCWTRCSSRAPVRARRRGGASTRTVGSGPGSPRWRGTATKVWASPRTPWSASGVGLRARPPRAGAADSTRRSPWWTPASPPARPVRRRRPDLGGRGEGERRGRAARAAGGAVVGAPSAALPGRRCEQSGGDSECDVGYGLSAQSLSAQTP